MTATLAVVIAQVQESYTALFIQRGHVAAGSWPAGPTSCCSLGLAPDELLGFEKQCPEIVLANEGVNYAALVDGHGNILYPEWRQTGMGIPVARPENASNGPGGAGRALIEHPLTQVPKSRNKILIGFGTGLVISGSSKPLPVHSADRWPGFVQDISGDYFPHLQLSEAGSQTAAAHHGKT